MSAEGEKRIPLIITLAFLLPPLAAPFMLWFNILPLKVAEAATLLSVLIGMFSFLIFRKGIVKIKTPDYNSIEIRSSGFYWLMLVVCAMAASDTWQALAPEKSNGFSGWIMYMATLIWMFEFAAFSSWVTAHAMLKVTHDFSGPSGSDNSNQ